MLVDSHCHLDRLDFKKLGSDLSGVLEAARQKGVQRFLCVGISEENRDAVVDIANQFEEVFCSVGVHPSDVGDQVVSCEALTEWITHDKVVALGETGLDYYYTPDNAKLQIESFSNHLQVAKQQKLPVIVHTRSAKEGTLATIKAHGCQDSAGVLHCFTEDWEMAKQALDLNYYISISGIVTFKNAEDLREVVKKIPAERLLVETDSPYLAPVPFRGKTNQPGNVAEVAKFIAELRGEDFDDLAQYTTDNFFRLFNRAAA